MKETLLQELVKTTIAELQLLAMQETLNIEESNRAYDQLLDDYAKLDGLYQEELKAVASKTASDFEMEFKNRSAVLEINRKRLDLREYILNEEIARSQTLHANTSYKGEVENLNLDFVSVMKYETDSLTKAVELAQIQYNEAAEKIEYIKDDTKLEEVNARILELSKRKAEMIVSYDEANKVIVPFKDLKTGIMSSYGRVFEDYNYNLEELDEEKSLRLRHLATLKRNVKMSSENPNMGKTTEMYNKSIENTNSLLGIINDKENKTELYKLVEKDPSNMEELVQLVETAALYTNRINTIDDKTKTFCTKASGYIRAQSKAYEVRNFWDCEINKVNQEIEKLEAKKAYIENVRKEANVVTNEEVKVVNEEVKQEEVITSVPVVIADEPKVKVRFEVIETKSATKQLLEKIKKSKLAKKIAMLAAGIVVVASVLTGVNNTNDKTEDTISNSEYNQPSETIADVDNSNEVVIPIEEEHVITVGDKVRIEEGIDCFRTSGSTNELGGLQAGEYNINRISLTDMSGKILGVTTDASMSAKDLAEQLGVDLKDVLVYPSIAANGEFKESSKDSFDPNYDVAWIMLKDAKVVQTAAERGINEEKGMGR